MTIGERIKKVRENLGMSQVAFADKINVSKQTLYKYENNIITNIPSDKIEIIAKLGNVSPSYIMGWEQCDHYTKLANTYFKSVMFWSEDKLLTKKQSELIRDHFSSLLLDYKLLIERFINTKSAWTAEKDAYIDFYSNGRNKKNINEIQEMYIQEDLEQQLDKMKRWIDAFPNYLARTELNDSDSYNYLEAAAAHERTDIEVTDEMRKHDDDLMDGEW